MEKCPVTQTMRSRGSFSARILLVLTLLLLSVGCERNRVLDPVSDFSEGKQKDARIIGTWYDSGYSTTAKGFYSGILYSESGYFSEKRSSCGYWHYPAPEAKQEVYDTILNTIVENGDWFTVGDTIHKRSVYVNITQEFHGGVPGKILEQRSWFSASRDKYRITGDTLSLSQGYSLNYNNGQYDTIWQYKSFYRKNEAASLSVHPD